MDKLPHFRTAVGGFHKGDVTDYISQTAAAHQQILLEKDKEISVLQSRIRDLEQAAHAALRAVEEATANIPASEETTVILPKEHTTPPAPPEMPLAQRELTAYRRAEATERLAIQRANRLYHTLEHICNSAQSQLDAAEAAAQSALSVVKNQMEQLENTFGTISTDLKDSMSKLSSIDVVTSKSADQTEVE